MSNEGYKKSALVDFLTQKTWLPSDALAGEFRLEIRGRSSVIVCGCRRILKYTPTAIVLLSKEFSVGIVGEKLICTAYHEGAVCIEGFVTGVEFDPEYTIGG